MINPTLERKLHSHLENMKPEAQQKVLEFAEALVITRPRPMSKRDLLSFAGTIPSEDLKLMSDAIEEGCGQVEPNAW